MELTKEEDWEMDGSSTSGTSSSMSSEASSSSSQSDVDNDDAYFHDEPKKMTTKAVKKNERSPDDFEMDASLNNRQHYRHNNVIGNDRIMIGPVPPPPRDDCSSSSSDSEYEDDDDLSLKDHIISAARQHLNDESFGDETMDVLMDAEDRLNVTPPPPPSSFSLSSSVLSGKKNGSKDACQSNYDEGNSIGDDEVSELSDGAASLLRGPIMAAKSFAQIQQQQQEVQQHDIMNDSTPLKVRMSSPIATKEPSVQEEPKTSCSTRREFVSSAQKMEPWSPWSMQQQQQQKQQQQQQEMSSSTPSAARVKFMPSAQKEQPPKSDVPATTTTTPSTSRRDFIHSAQKSEMTQPWSPWSTQQQNQYLQSQEIDTPSAARLKFLPSAQKATTPSHCTPSTARSGFISSTEKAKWSPLSSSSTPSSIKGEQRESPHQDSVSSIGANSPSAYFQKATQLQLQQQVMTSHERTTPPNVTFESSATLSPSTAFEEVKRKSPVSEEVEAFLQMNKHILKSKEKSLDNIIELGERQMKMGAASKDASKDEPSNVPTKKPFLRKGARKEPSALHKRSHLNSAKTTTTTQDAATESASDRKARLEQLEKMQEDLLKDLERRKMRKEEAHKERRREKNETVAEERGSLKSKSGGGAATRSAMKSQKRTPLHSGRVNGASVQQTPSQARSRTATKKPTFAKSAESKMKPSPRDLSVSPTPIVEVEGKSLQGNISSNNKAKKATNETLQTKSAVQVRTRSTSRSRSSVQLSTINMSDEKSSEMLVKAMEDMKKKEEEQMALIKNMRRRQEVALREAEGERERAKAWAAAERESVKKWVEEQRALIRKDRHKAANAALLASRKASRGKQDEDRNEEEDALKAELEEMRLEMKKVKIEAEEARKLKEQVRKQERMINALKRGDTTSANTVNNKIGDGGKRRTALDDRTSNENVQPRPKTAGNNAEHSAKKQPSATKERPNHDPTGIENNLVDEEDLPQRKPYNAADYASGKPGIEAHSIPQFVSAPTPPGQGGRPSQIITYQNGTTKEVLPDGTTTISFANGDRKRTYANEKKGIEVYYYAATKTTQVTHQDGSNSFHFPNKQIEHHYADGRKEITFPDGTKQMVFSDGTRDTTFSDGMRLIDYPDGNQRLVRSS
eukprot:scaffold26582_cov155-Skeletonema_menzelii.AAC.3